MPGRKASEALRRHQVLEAAHQVALRRGLEGLTVRAVAARARLSHGLVLFHFKRKDQLISALLDRVLAVTLSIPAPDHRAPSGAPLDRLRALLRQEVDRLSGDPRQVRLFLEYGTFSARRRAIRHKISLALERYRSAFGDLAAEVLNDKAVRLSGVTPHGLAAIAVSVVLGSAVQAMIRPDGFDVGEYLAAVQGIVGGLQIAA